MIGTFLAGAGLLFFGIIVGWALNKTSMEEALTRGYAMGLRGDDEPVPAKPMAPLFDAQLFDAHDQPSRMGRGHVTGDRPPPES